MQGTGHTLFERRLHRDIVAKNALSKEYESKIRLVRRFREEAAKAHSRRKQKKYGTSAERLLGEAESLRIDVLKLIQNLEPRIREEMRFSEQEVTAFHAQFEKEHLEWLEAQKRRQTAEQALRMLAGDSKLVRRQPTVDEAVALENARADVARSESIERRESRDVARIQGELDSEARDKVFFTRELQRIVAERITLSS